MVNPLKSILALIFTLCIIGCSGEGENQNIKATQLKVAETDSLVDAAFLTEFESCTFSNSFFDARRNIIVKAVPLKIYQGYYSYKIDTSFIGFTVKAIIFGICSNISPASNDCSLASDITLVLDAKFDVAKNHLLTSSGLDYSLEKRLLIDNNDIGPTLRPLLHEGKNNTAVLYCDTGNL